MSFPNYQSNPEAATPVRLSNGTSFLDGAQSSAHINTSTTTTVKASAGVLGSIIIALAFFFAYRPGKKSRAAAVVIGVGALGLIAGGVLYSMMRTRESARMVN